MRDDKGVNGIKMILKQRREEKNKELSEVNVKRCGF